MTSPIQHCSLIWYYIIGIIAFLIINVILRTALSGYFIVTYKNKYEEDLIISAIMKKRRRKIQNNKSVIYNI